MSALRKHTPSYQNVDGFRLPGYFVAEAYHSALTYNPRPDDLFIVSYPKCGTTWMQNVVACILNEGESFRSALEFLKYAPFLEKSGAKAVETMRRPGAIKSHLPFDLIPYSPETKYIFVARNPKDCCVSHYHHTKAIPGYNFSDGEFDVFFELFITGEVDFGDYFDSLLSWFEHRKDPNVLFVTYEQMKENPHKYIKEIASFIDSKYSDKLQKDPQLLEKIVKHTSFNYMQDNMKKHFSELSNCPQDEVVNNPDIPESIRKMIKTRDSMFTPDAIATAFVRKGETRGWRKYFSAEQSKQLDIKFLERTKGTDIPQLWKDYM